MKKELSIEELIVELGKDLPQTQKDTQLALSLDRLEEIAKIYNGEDKIISSLELVDKIKARPPELQMMSGWKTFDDILKGLRPQQLVTLAAPTKNGKTSFALDLTRRLKEFCPTWFPFEEGAEELVTKCLERGEQPPLFYTPEVMTGNTLLWIEKKIIEAKAKFNTKIAFIDHLHFIVPFSEERQDLRIGETMRELKRIAKKWNVCVVIIAHLKKTKLAIQPDLEDLRDSSFIAQESDTVIMLWRETKRENGEVVMTSNVNVSIQANRRTGKTGNIKMTFDGIHYTEGVWKDEQLEKAFPTEVKIEHNYNEPDFNVQT